MARIAGVELPQQKRIDIALTYLYGVGRSNVQKLLSVAKVEPATRVKDLVEDQITRLQKAVETVPVEGDLRRFVLQNIKRLEEIGTYRGLRHRRNLPSRGQRTRSNARTKRGKRVTIGTVRKEIVARMGGAAKVQPGRQVPASPARRGEPASPSASPATAKPTTMPAKK